MSICRWKPIYRRPSDWIWENEGCEYDEEQSTVSTTRPWTIKNIDDNYNCKQQRALSSEIRVFIWWWGLRTMTVLMKRRSPRYLIIIFLVSSHYMSLLLGSQSIWYAYAYCIVHIQESRCRKGVRTHNSNDCEQMSTKIIRANKRIVAP
jgi:hypothetical protein